MSVDDSMNFDDLLATITEEDAIALVLRLRSRFPRIGSFFQPFAGVPADSPPFEGERVRIQMTRYERSNKLITIREIRKITGLGLRGAKDIVDALDRGAKVVTIAEFDAFVGEHQKADRAIQDLGNVGAKVFLEKVP